MTFVADELELKTDAFSKVPQITLAFWIVKILQRPWARPAATLFP